MNLYRHKKWQAYRAGQIKLHGGICAHCLRPGDEVILQVHHRAYVHDRMPWDYPYEECVVLCRGCHAKEHGEIRPSKDWMLIGHDDLGALDGTCERCGQALRYAHMVYHPKWWAMIVGETCCDDLTESTVGTETHADFLNYLDRRKRFVGSKKWQAAANGCLSIRRGGIAILIVPTETGAFRFHLDGAKGKIEHPSLLDAQISAFDYVESGKAAAYLAERRQK